MKRLVKKIAAPVGIIALAIAGAFGTTSMKAENSLTIKDGHLRTSPNNCTPEKECTTVNTGQLCTIMEGGQFVQLYGKINPSDTSCPQTLYEPQE